MLRIEHNVELCDIVTGGHGSTRLRANSAIDPGDVEISDVATAALRGNRVARCVELIWRIRPILRAREPTKSIYRMKEDAAKLGANTASCYRKRSMRDTRDRRWWLRSFQRTFHVARRTAAQLAIRVRDRRHECRWAAREPMVVKARYCSSASISAAALRGSVDTRAMPSALQTDLAAEANISIALHERSGNSTAERDSTGGRTSFLPGTRNLGSPKVCFSGNFIADWAMPYPRHSGGATGGTRSVAAPKCERFSMKIWIRIAIDREADIPRSVIDGLGRVGVLGNDRAEGIRRPRIFANGVLQGAGGNRARDRFHFGFHQRASFHRHSRVAAFRNARAKTQWLPWLVNGEQLAAFALTEEKPARTRPMCRCKREPSEDGRISFSTAKSVTSPTPPSRRC